MEEDGLYPGVDIPTVTPWEGTEEEGYKPAPMFDYEKGDFVCDGNNRVIMEDGLKAYQSWVYKVLNTQLGGCVAYMDIGVDFEEALAESTPSAAEAALERTLTEALLDHPMTQRVRDFEFKWSGDQLLVQFAVQGKDLPAFNVTYNATA